MNDILTQKGRDDVRYIAVESSSCGSTLRLDEGIAVYRKGLMLLVIFGDRSDSCLEHFASAASKVRKNGHSLHCCIYTGSSFRHRTEKLLSDHGLDENSIVTGEAALGEAAKHCQFVLTVPAGNGGFYTLKPCGKGAVRQPLIINMNGDELEKALTAACEAAERRAGND